MLAVQSAAKTVLVASGSVETQGFNEVGDFGKTQYKTDVTRVGTRSAGRVGGRCNAGGREKQDVEVRRG
jgi:hypothetical protein